ncbi:MAG: allophanate hydrolase [Candidatus Thiodiazotropha taylori]|nr:allophanate hydrolase [Candidatus Thiodiazotropha taylori]MCG7926975.1 allophanate hydrolase [Candidatus Thiodiazotropha taylori]MCG7936596.1 allophanate hydrolase [Candidatus Thiodiazotropha taylori]MCG7972436.1 allophanate hydrolase [Candidatus Thiodiazotropha taylori]MCG8091423.1 allophanate hydrolase [Candidatus Thiodiazotropha taylori]
MTTTFPFEMTISALRSAYLGGRLTPEQVMQTIRKRALEYEDYNIWIHLLSEAEQAHYLDRLQQLDLARFPLWGIPFAIKDNIDLNEIPTTAACIEFAYTPTASATVVERLIAAGAIPVGKTNLDQFATGLNGTRSPWGACRNAFEPDYISGGSSSGSAVSVALGLASFSLGTDTAGSGRVPACFNNLIGLKPSRGLLSTKGLVPACRSLDCITVFTCDSDDANLVLSVAEAYDADDEYSRNNPFQNQQRQYGERQGPLKIGVIPDQQLNFFGDQAYQQAYRDTLKQLETDGIEFVEIDYQPFAEAARLLYEGPWVAERYLATQPLIDDNPQALYPVVREIIEPGKSLQASSLFKAQYRLSGLKAVCDRQLAAVDCLLTPTAGTCFTIEQMLEEPILRNSQLGYYTNFMNLLDLASVAVPTQMTASGLPFGITLVGDAFTDRVLLSIAKRIHRQFELNLGASQYELQSASQPAVGDHSEIDVVVCGAHLQGLPLNWQLTERGATLKAKTETAPIYRMYALPGGPPARPGLILDEVEGAAIEVEVWSMPQSQFGSFVAAIPSPLGIGKLQLADGSEASGFICEPYAISKAEEITGFGGWKAYLNRP